MVNYAMERTGFGVWPAMTMAETMEATKVAEENGFESAWVVESSLNPGKDSISVLGGLAVTTQKIKLGTGIINIFSRTATLVASTAATLDDMSGGRMILGLGTGHRVMGQYHSVEFDDPLMRMREYVTTIKKLVAGEVCNFEGRFVSVKNLKLNLQPVRKKIPIYVAAVSPKMARLAGEIGDGSFSVLNSPRQMEQLIAEVKKGAEAAGRSFNEVDIVCYLPAFIMEDYERALSAARRVIANYGSSIFYRRLYKRMGYGREAELMEAAWRKGSLEEAQTAVNEKMAKDITLLGTTEECRKRIGEYRRAGVKLPVIQPFHVAGNLTANVIPSLNMLSK